MLAMTFTLPPHCSQVSISMPKTRFSRCAQLIARQVSLELLLHVGGQRPAFLAQCLNKRRVVLRDQLIEKSGLGAMALVAR